MTAPTIPLKYLAGINKRSLAEDTDPEQAIRYLDIGAVGRGYLVGEPQQLRFEDAPSRARRLVSPGDTIISTVRTYLRAVWPVTGDTSNLVVSTGFAVLTPSAIEPRFFSWWVRSDSFIEDVVTRSVGVSYPAINALDLGNLPIRVPPWPEQRAIADYLDTETARIDALITKKRRMIELLEEQRKSVTIAAVMGSARELVYETRRSTLPWADGIAQPFDEVLLRLVARQGTGHTPSREHHEWWLPEECVVPWITTGEVQQVRSDAIEFISETRERVSHAGIENSSAEVHPSGTVFLCRTASAGYSGIMETDMATSQDFATWTCGPLLRPRYLLLCLRAMRSDLLGRLAMGSTHKTIYMPDIQSIRIPLPPVLDQDRIVDWAWGRFKAALAAAAAIERQIGVLIEHRQALITAAVTGEFDIPVAA